VIAAALPVEELRRRFPAGSVKQIFVVDGDGRLIGSVDPIGSENGEAKTIGDLVGEPVAFLLPGDDLRTALDRFSGAAQEILPVIDNAEHRRIIGYVSEAYALRRYAHQLEAHRGAHQDDAGIFSPAAADSAMPRQTK
jgi:CIC family chloride channel protein